MVNIAAAVERFRAREAGVMADSTGTLRRPGVHSFDPGTGQSTPVATTIYSGPGYVRPAPGLVGHETETGVDVVRVVTYIGKLPVDIDARKDDVWEQTTSRDVQLVGRSFRVTDVLRDEFEITRRLALEEVVT